MSPLLGMVFEDLSQYKLFAAPLSVVEDMLHWAFVAVDILLFVTVVGVIVGFLYAAIVLRNPIKAFVPTVKAFFMGLGEILALLLRLVPFFIVLFVPIFHFSDVLDRVGEMNRFGINDRNASQVSMMMWILFGMALLGCFFVWPSLRGVRAIAMLSFKEAIRGRILYVFILFFIPFLFAGWYLDKTPEAVLLNLCGFVNTAMTYILLPLVIFMTSMSLPNEIQTRIVQTVVTKPVRRSEIVLGRTLGYLAVFTIVLVGMGVVSLGYIYSQLNESQRKTLWVARRPIFSNRAVPDFVAEYQKQVGSLAGLRHEFYSMMFFQNQKWNGIGTNVGKEWAYRYFIGGKADHSAHYGFQFDPKALARRENARGEPCCVVQMEFDVFKMTKGDPTREEGKEAEKSGVRCQIEVHDRGGEGNKPEIQIHRINHQRITEMLVPEKLFENKFVEVIVRCTTASQYVGMARGDLYLLAKDGRFEANFFFKGLASIWLKMAFIVCVAVAASTALKGFVTVLLASGVYVLGLFWGFMSNVAMGAEGTAKGGGPIESFIRLMTRMNQVTPLDESNWLIAALKKVDEGLLVLMKYATLLVPNLSNLDVAPYVAHGVDVPGVLILRNAILVTAYVIPVLVVGYFFLRNRELARMNASRKRKIAYLLIIVVLFTTQVFVGERLHQEAKAERLAHESLGEVDPISGTAQLVCFGFRGVAVTFLWNDVMDLNRKERWFEIKPVLKSITLLQPNFHSPWQYQAWNMSYNIANAWEAVKDKYYWIAEGAKFMQEACAKNQGVADLQWYTGFIYFNRFSVHDDHKYLREHFKKEAKERTDVKFTASRRDRADPFDNAYEWFQSANLTVLEKKKAPKGMGITPFLSHPAKALTTFAEFQGKEGVFGVDALEAWSQAHNAWLEFGRGLGVARKDGIGERDQFVHRLEYDPAEYEKLSDDTKFWIQRYGNIVRYWYWKTRVKAEGTPQMEGARESFYLAEKAWDDGDYDRAIAKFEEGFPKFRAVFDVPEFKNQLSADMPIMDDAQDWERLYMRMLTNLSRPLPAKRPFHGLFGMAFDDALLHEAKPPTSSNPNIPKPEDRGSGCSAQAEMSGVDDAAGGPPSAFVRRRTVYNGRVQGVGFRARTVHAARRFRVGGWVRNRIDGAVELIVEGPASDVEAFLGEVALRMAANIERVEIREEQPVGGLEGFSVKD